MRCPTCGAELDIRARVCPECRMRLPKRNVEPGKAAKARKALFRSSLKGGESEETVLPKEAQVPSSDLEEIPMDPPDHNVEEAPKGKKDRKKNKTQTIEEEYILLDAVRGEGYAKKAYAPVFAVDRETLPESGYEKVLKTVAVALGGIAIALVAMYFL